MNLVELDQALRKLRLSGMADVLETRLLQAQAEQMVPIDLVAALVADELQRRQDRLLARRHKQAHFRDPERSLDGFDFAFNKKINRALVFEAGLFVICGVIGRLIDLLGRLTGSWGVNWPQVAPVGSIAHRQAA